jgi:hypothetical protein
MPAEEFEAHRAAHRAEPIRSTRMFKPCRKCDPPQLIPSAEWRRHLQWHANHDPNRPRTRSGTSAWRTLRAKVIARDRHRCRRCGSRENLQCHHLAGGSHWRNHSMTDAELVPMSLLITLCRDCHDAEPTV